MPSPANASEPADLAARLRRVLSSIDLDCECRAKLDKALERFAALESQQRIRSGLREVRRQRDWIAAQLSFLGELDDITGWETDHSVFEEMALLFNDIAGEAAAAASALRVLKAHLSDR